MTESYLDKLDPCQVKAVTHSAKVLQICAGPGSGKTRALTTRVAYLVKEKGVDPGTILVVTFTNKAANEMRERLFNKDLLGNGAAYLRIGTFHSFCARLIRAFASEAGVSRNFGIADSGKSSSISEGVFKECFKCRQRGKDKANMMKFISDSKNDGMNYDEYFAHYGGNPKYNETTMFYHQYKAKLEEMNLLDFDDLIIVARDLLRNHPEAADTIRYVLVDEFQDTNTAQYQVIQLLTANGAKPLTVVGDRDQSIYGWRSARIENFEKMFEDFPGTEMTELNQNYRSTKSILANASHVVKKDNDRPERDLFTNNQEGAQVSLLRTNDETFESATVASEVQRIVKYSNGLIKYKDIAILYRMHNLTIHVEKALRQARVPYVLISQSSFMERQEIKPLLYYVQFFNNPRDSDAFNQVINVPRRGVGQQTLTRLHELASARGVDMLEATRIAVTQRAIELNKSCQSSLASFVKLAGIVQELMTNDEPAFEILKTIMEVVHYQDYVKGHFDKDVNVRLANVDELLVFAQRLDKDVDMDRKEGKDTDTKMQRFLDAVSLWSSKHDNDSQHNYEDGSVQCLTMHGAKGLEWPVVFIIGCEEGYMPAFFAVNSSLKMLIEETRVLYVAMTRAKCFLYMTYTKERTTSFGVRPSTLSRFIYDLPEDTAQLKTPTWNKEVRTWVANLLSRPAIEEDPKNPLESIGDDFPATDISESDDDFDEDEIPLLSRCASSRALPSSIRAASSRSATATSSQPYRNPHHTKPAARPIPQTGFMSAKKAFSQPTPSIYSQSSSSSSSSATTARKTKRSYEQFSANYANSANSVLPGFSSAKKIATTFNSSNSSASAATSSSNGSSQHAACQTPKKSRH
ncbi:P-loop containing nucleoside triphosphate hydrolase protein [Gongronella butleri]|nr:P-loop containing nucleoside triphosphate hydrolase protein [Gongronella butleri]